MKKLFVFDLDGTLIDSVASVAHCMNTILIDYGLMSVEKDYYRRFMGDGPGVLSERIISFIQNKEKFTLIDEKNTITRLAEDYVEQYNLLDDNQTQLYPMIKSSLDFLKSKNIELAICTNKPFTATINIINKLFPKGYFNDISALTKTKSRKPNPELLEDILYKAHLKAEDVLYFGDTQTDILTAKAAKVEVVAVTWGFRDRKELLEADYIIDHPIQIKDFINE